MQLFLKKIFILILILFICFCVRPVQAQFSTGDLILAYEYALETNNKKNIMNIERAIQKDSTTLSYIMANRSDLYVHFQKNQSEPSSSILVSETEQLEVGNVLILPNENTPQNKLDAQKENAKERLQRLNNHLSGELEERSFKMVVSGVGQEARRSLIKLLKNELSMIKYVRESYYKNSQVKYQIKLRDIDLKKFADVYDNKRFGSFVLDLVNLSEKQADFVLKRN